MLGSYTQPGQPIISLSRSRWGDIHQAGSYIAEKCIKPQGTASGGVITIASGKQVSSSEVV